MSSNRRCSANSSGGGYGKASGPRSYAAARGRRVGVPEGPDGAKAVLSTRVATRNALTRSLGAATASVESTRFEVWSGDRVLLCSDGLSDAIAETEIASVLDMFPGEPHKVVHALIAAALFMLIGADPRVEWLPEEIARDERGFDVAG